jgi:hypothetical protein
MDYTGAVTARDQVGLMVSWIFGGTCGDEVVSIIETDCCDPDEGLVGARGWDWEVFTD